MRESPWQSQETSVCLFIKGPRPESHTPEDPPAASETIPTAVTSLAPKTFKSKYGERGLVTCSAITDPRHLILGASTAVRTPLPWKFGQNFFPFGEHGCDCYLFVRT